MHKSMQKGIRIFSTLLKENERTALILLGTFIFADILFIKTSSDVVIFSILLIYMIFIKILKLSSKLTFLFCIGFLTVMSIDYFFNGASVSTEKAAVWLILFLTVGVVQEWKE